PPPPPPPVRQTIVKRAPRQIDMGILRAPTHIPEKVALIKEEDMPPSASDTFSPGVPGIPGASNATITSILATTAAVPAKAPEVKDAPKEKPIQRVKVGGQVIAASLVKRTVPQYPPLARQARVQGTVQFTAIIGRDGTIQNLQLIQGHPLLVP